MLKQSLTIINSVNIQFTVIDIYSKYLNQQHYNIQLHTRFGGKHCNASKEPKINQMKKHGFTVQTSVINTNAKMEYADMNAMHQP